MIYLVLMTSYVIGLFHDIGLYNTNRFSVWILLTYLLVATMICFYLVLLSFVMSSLIQTVRPEGICSEARNTETRGL